ncbi:MULTISPECIES: hypothetical protein [Nitrosomonas]|uniref:Uncharacterized protein n=1 Tax=Nitrosomonas communis TaxID=44574 RepID=A0A0F7KCQ4_9PROT|nr:MULTISPECIES: hypothetical protein [Nitrosomonas]AKH36723.1 hypothetical protein AAW31_01075 [Nitrosomonas communis]AKH37366.1 hypothetical protein AAW31_05370 [Nitrosomonas communis]TYP71416.1 hypothetical protein BCL69_11142 [Nitrosomonas communis]UVS61782.1 hypothetical protein NX761_01130 [Nitrosomonas sp. PLL12]UVS62591.1 hypothetical protein NX761_05575 [Nitrosomonas sp. PLL12]
MVKQLTQAGIAAFVLVAMLYAGSVIAHGKVSLEEDPCTRQINENMVHLSTYQPQHDKSAHYCTEIPLAGDTYLVIDLIDAAIRNMPVKVNVYRGSETEGESVLQLPAELHPDGVINGITNLEKGLYSVIVTAEGVPPLKYQYRLRVEMVDYMKIVRASILPVMVLLLLAWLIYKIKPLQRLRKWRTAQRSQD